MDLKTSTSTSISASAGAGTATGTTATMMVQITTEGVPKLHCPVCNKGLISLSGYVNHLKKHEPPGGFLCRYCDARYCTDEELKRHRDSVHTTIACRLCKDVTFISEEEYREHIRCVHNGIDREMYKCDKCGAEYKTSEPYRRHMNTQCGTVKPFKCDQCFMAFVTKYNLKQHKESHTGERKFCCSFCGKNFLQKGRLVEHERSHTGEKPYKCDVCGKCFAHRESIVTHSSIHTGIRLVECKCCLSRFSCYSNLIKHRRTRPDTCGLPLYDPPKNRIRSHRSRIPPTLNPTSEIKISSLNKIIKPDDKEHFTKIKAVKKETSEAETLPRKRGRKPNTAKKYEMRSKMTVFEHHSNDNGDIHSGVVEPGDTKEEGEEEIKLKTEKRDLEETDAIRKSNKEYSKTSTDVLDRRENRISAGPGRTATPSVTDLNKELIDSGKSNWNDMNSDEDYPDFEPAMSEDDTDTEEHKEELKLPVPIVAVKKEDSDDGKNADQNSRGDTAESEYLGEREYISTDLYVKSEDDNIFNEKDKLLDCLLNDGNMTELPVKSSPRPCVKAEDDILQETEVVLIKDEIDVPPYAKEDILDIKDISGDEIMACKILLEDVTQKYPQLKDEESVRVPYPFSAKRPSRHKTLRKYRKRERRGMRTPTDEAETNLNSPKRLAKLSQHELRERLKMLKKEEKSWQCPHCIKIYHMRKPFEKHLRDNHQRPEEEIKSLFKVEGIGVVNEDIFKCKICEKIYLVEKRMLAHEKLHGPDGNLIFKCPCYCNLYFATKEEATTHAQHEHRDLLYCEICEKFMTGHDALKNHKRNQHQQKERQNIPRNLVCDKCGKKFSGRTSLTDHVRSDCGRKPLYPCTICGKHLTTAGILKTHLLLHKDETPYQCDQCGKTFKVKSQYKTHIKTRHTDAKPFKCHLCPKEYPYRESLLTHMTVHTGIKRFLCNGCGKRFTCISNLQAHRKVHADTCGLLPLNAKATQYMGVQKGNLLLGAKPEAGLDYKETNTLIAKEVLDHDLPMAQELNYPSEPSAPLATVPLNYTHQPQAQLTSQMLLSPQTLQTHFVNEPVPSAYH